VASWMPSLRWRNRLLSNKASTYKHASTKLRREVRRNNGSWLNGYNMLRRGEPIFYAFDVLWLDGEDLREHPTLERKRILKDLVRNQPRILYARHVLAHGIDLFRLMCEQDLEGMVCKRRNAAYVTRADCKPPVS